MKKVFAAMAALAFPALVSASVQDDGRQFAVEGVGMATCARFIEARASAPAEYQRMLGFIEGYLSAANLYEPDTFDLTPWHNAAALDLIVEHHCTQHPDDRLVGVTQRMVGGFRPFRIARFSQMLEVGDREHRTYVYEAILRRAQAALQLRGYYSGPEDGTYSPELREGFRKFQREVGLDETGVPDPATLWKLLNP
ncbi:peptidoglycan-binding domain-containing protein [Erythrobacter sp.]|uniref:peptidoglycan-binding domain-containing protein n=1 Tax=Erythrobacter sp. TaxID=1042 RepID=UPI001425EE4D|nr:peptidoglycan-binding domain-containing protein [Erythrobacter sp.]QIQ85689.1 MAG: peptidoglycan-binding protein [Erythrobacter sp.]